MRGDTTKTSHAVNTVRRVSQCHASYLHPVTVQIIYLIVCASFERSSLLSMLARSGHTVYIQVVFRLACGHFTREGQWHMIKKNCHCTRSKLRPKLVLNHSLRNTLREKTIIFISPFPFTNISFNFINRTLRITV